MRVLGVVKTCEVCTIGFGEGNLGVFFKRREGILRITATEILVFGLFLGRAAARGAPTSV